MKWFRRQTNTDQWAWMGEYSPNVVKLIPQEELDYDKITDARIALAETRHSFQPTVQATWTKPGNYVLTMIDGKFEPIFIGAPTFWISQWQLADDGIVVEIPDHELLTITEFNTWSDIHNNALRKVA